jgi:hypothetical protein
MLRCPRAAATTLSLLCAGIILLLQPAPVLAADAKGNFVVRGMGTRTCKDYVEAVKQGEGPSHDYLVWMEGYFTALNKTTPETFDVLPVVAIGHTASVVYGSCQGTPDARLEDVLSAAVRTLHPYRVKAQSRLVEVSVGDVYAAVRQETMVFIQKALAKQGLYAGPADGMFSPDLQKALLAYQGKKELTKSGAPDAPTLLNLIKDTPPG